MKNDISIFFQNMRVILPHTITYPLGLDQNHTTSIYGNDMVQTHWTYCTARTIEKGLSVLALWGEIPENS